MSSSVNCHSFVVAGVIGEALENIPRRNLAASLHELPPTKGLPLVANSLDEVKAQTGADESKLYAVATEAHRQSIGRRNPRDWGRQA